MGHDVDGLAIITDDFGIQNRVAYEKIRLEQPFERRAPNWHDLKTGCLAQPDAAVLKILRQMMARRMPPGPTYQDLVEEIWGRGFEIFLVGGTVRDILAGSEPNDIDLVTTMPLKRMLSFVHEMYRTTISGNNSRGFIRIGGKPASGDPFIDLKVFSSSMPGTGNATFGVGFDRDVSYRDFTCNAVYFDPKNEVIVDPTGHGVEDCRTRTLRLVEGTHDPFQMAQIFIRAIKFMGRGFNLVDDTRERLVQDYSPALAAMNRQMRKRYFVTQVISKHRDDEGQRKAVIQFMADLSMLGCLHVWNDYFGDMDLAQP